MSKQGQTYTSPNADGPSKELGAQAAKDADKVAGKAKKDLDAVAQVAKDDLNELRQQADKKVKEVTENTKSFAGDQKDMAADQVSGVADAINKVADELDKSDQSTVARYARDLASGLSRAGGSIKDHDVDELTGMAEDFGRKQPVAFLGVAALAGFAASRFALASAHRRDSARAADNSSPDRFPNTRTGTGVSIGGNATGQHGMGDK